MQDLNDHMEGVIDLTTFAHGNEQMRCKMERNAIDNLKIAQAYARSKGYSGNVKYYKQWNGSAVYKMMEPPSGDSGEPLVVVVSKDGDCTIKSYFCIE